MAGFVLLWLDQAGRASACCGSVRQVSASFGGFRSVLVCFGLVGYVGSSYGDPNELDRRSDKK
jgi:hypothetical protein